MRLGPILRFNGAVRRDPAIAAWMKRQSGELGAFARQWFRVMRSRGDDVRETLHDGFPNVCVDDAPFAYVNVFTAHMNVGFLYGAELPDPARLLEGTGKRGRHVKLRPETGVDADALRKLIDEAYADIKERIRDSVPNPRNTR